MPFRRYRECPPGLGTLIAARSGFLRPFSGPSGAHRREKHDLTQAAGSGKHHDKAVNAQPDSTRRRHPVLERLDEGLVVGLRLLIAPLELGGLLLEAPPLLIRIVELAEGVGNLDPTDEGLPALDQARLGTVGLGEGR